MSGEPARGGIAPENARRSPDGLIGRTLGEFVIREKLGQGGFGAVFRAEQPLLAREAVIKVLQSRGRVSEAAIQRFLREARLASSLDHPYAAHIYAFGAEPDGLLWIAMELVRGTPLDKLLKAQGPLPLTKLVPLLDRICEVVHSAHEQGIVHRDLKPANVMVLSRAGRLLPKLLDFGVAKLREEQHDASESPVPLSTISEQLARAASTQLTERGLFIGSPHYMAPEQWINAAAVDQRTDLYALGVLCFEALTGRHPFEGETVLAVAKGHASKPVPGLEPEFPEGLSAVLTKAMSKRSADRFSTALEFAAAFRAAARLGEEPAELPQLDEAVRETVIAEGPQPLAEAVSALEAARSVGQALLAVDQVFTLLARYLGVLAIASRARVGPGGAADAPRVRELFSALRQQSLADEQWVSLSRELCRPFAQLRAAHPIPELVTFFFEPGSEREGGGARLFERGPALVELGSAAESQQQQLLARELSRLAQLLRSVAFLFDYRLVVGRGDRGESWSGVRRARRNARPLSGDPLAESHPALLNRDGALALELWPLVQVRVPTPGAPEELFLLEGNGRHGAKLVAIPLGFERHDETLWDWFRDRGLGASEAAAPEGAEEQAPYLGLAAFTAGDAKNFFGREQEAEAFANRLRVQPILAVVGPSGAGKSSFVQAGVIPLLPDTWRAITLRPGPSPLASLAQKLTQLGAPMADLPAAIARDGDALALHLRNSALQTQATLLLVIDQFEELLTLCLDATERQLFSRALVQAARASEERVRVVLTLRDDFLIRAQQLAALREELGQGLQLLGTPAPEDLMRILTCPARQVGYEFEDPKLPEEMIRDLADQPGALALLSFTAHKLWELRDRHFRRLSRSAYQSLGGVGGALAQHAEATLATMSADQQALVRESFRHLVTAEHTRAVLTRREMTEVLGGGPAATSVLEQLITARLLTASEGEGAEDQIEVIHEALLSSWPRLVQWQQEDAESLRMRHQLRAAARQWEERGRGKGLLWRKEALMEYRVWRSRYPGRLTESEESFAAASLRDEARGRRTKRLAITSAFVVLVIGLAVLFRANKIAAEKAIESKSRLATIYEEQGRQLLLSGDPMRGILYLDKAQQEGASGPALQYLFGRATRALDAQLLTLPHADFVSDARFSPDGTRAVTASRDKTGKLWDASTGKLIGSLEGHRDRVMAAHFNPDGSRVVTASIDGTAAIWDGRSGKLIASLEVGPPIPPLPDAIASADFSPDGKLVAAAVGNVAKIWDTSALTPVATLQGHSDWIEGLAFSPKTQDVFTWGRDGTIRRWRPNGQTVYSIAANTSPDPYLLRISHLSLSADGKRIATVGWDGAAQVWDADTGKAISSTRDAEGPPYSVSINPDGTRLVSTNAGNVAKIWNAATGEIIRFLEGHAGRVRFITFSADGKQILTTSNDGTSKLWNALGGAALMTFVGHADSIVSAAFAPDGNRIITASFDGTAKVWDVRGGPLVTALDEPGYVTYAGLSVDGRRALVLTEEGSVKLWDLNGSRIVKVIDNEKGTYPVAAWSPDESRLALSRGRGPPGAATAAKQEAGEVLIIEIPTGRTIARMREHTKPVTALAFNAAGTRLLTAGDQSARLWNAADGTLLTSLQSDAGNVTAAAINPDGTRVITGTDDKKVVMWNALTGSSLFTLDDFKGPIRWLAFASDGNRFATASRDKRIIVWDSASRRRLLTLPEAKANANTVQFNNAGTLLLTADVVGSASVWDLRTGRLLSQYVQGASAMDHAMFAQDGNRIITSMVNNVMVWDSRSDARNPSEISAYIRCKVPFRIESEQLVPTPLDGSCAR